MLKTILGRLFMIITSEAFFLFEVARGRRNAAFERIPYKESRRGKVIRPDSFVCQLFAYFCTQIEHAQFGTYKKEALCLSCSLKT